MEFKWKQSKIYTFLEAKHSPIWSKVPPNQAGQVPYLSH